MTVSTRPYIISYARKGEHTKFPKNDGKVHKIGKNQRVNDRLPKLPAKKVNASHCPK